MIVKLSSTNSTPTQQSKDKKLLQDSVELSIKDYLFNNKNSTNSPMSSSNKENILSTPPPKKRPINYNTPQKTLNEEVNRRNEKLDKKDVSTISTDIVIELLGLIFSKLQNSSQYYILFGSVNVYLQNTFCNQSIKYRNPESKSGFGDIDIICLHDTNKVDPRKKIIQCLNEFNIEYNYDGKRNILIKYNNKIYLINLIYSNGDEDAFPKQLELISKHSKEDINTNDLVVDIQVKLKNGKEVLIASFNDYDKSITDL